MKLRFVICWAILLCLTHTLARAQSITLDSLWGKQVETVFGMCFTPDSKYLLVSFDKYRTTIYNTQTGEEVRTFTTHYGCFEMKFSNDGTKLYSFSSGGVDILDANTFETIDTVSFYFKGEEGATQYDVSDDGRNFVVKNGYEGINTDYYRMRVISYPEKKVIWMKDVVRWNSNIRYANSKVTFTNDGNYVLGLNMNMLFQWDWKDSLSNGVALVTQLPNLELISYSPNKKYMVLKSNYIYSIYDNHFINPDVEGLSNGSTIDGGYASAFTHSNLCFITVNNTVPANPLIIDLNKKKIVLRTTLRGIYSLIVNSEATIVVMKYGDGVLKVFKIKEIPSGVDQILTDSSKIRLIVTPNPGEFNTSISVFSTKEITNVNLYIRDINGKIVYNLFSGILRIGESRYSLENTTIESGYYIAELLYQGNKIFQPFVITK